MTSQTPPQNNRVFVDPTVSDRETGIPVVPESGPHGSIRFLLWRSGMTVREFAEAFQVQFQHASLYFRRTRRPLKMRVKTAKKFAKVFGVTHYEILARNRADIKRWDGQQALQKLDPPPRRGQPKEPTEQPPSLVEDLRRYPLGKQE